MGNSKGFINLKDKLYHYVYQTKCIINGKTYIGRHSTNNLNDKYLGSGKILKRAISKYGKQNFKLIILDFFDSYEELVKEESFIVTKEWCKLQNNYNLIEGAENPIMYGERNPAWKGGISKDPNYRVSGIPYDFSGSNNPMYGYKYTDAEKLKMLKSQPNVKPVVIFSIHYNSIREASKKLKRSKDYIKYRCESIKFKDCYYKQ